MQTTSVFDDDWILGHDEHEITTKKKVEGDNVEKAQVSAAGGRGTRARYFHAPSALPDWNALHGDAHGTRHDPGQDTHHEDGNLTMIDDEKKFVRANVAAMNHNHANIENDLGGTDGRDRDADATNGGLNDGVQGTIGCHLWFAMSVILNLGEADSIDHPVPFHARPVAFYSFPKRVRVIFIQLQSMEQCEIIL